MSRTPEAQKVIDSIPELKELLDSIPLELQEKVWKLESFDFLDKLQAGNTLGALRAMIPKKPENVKTYEEINKEDEESIFVCMRCVDLEKNPSCIVTGSVKRECSACKEAVYMSPGTCYSFAMLKNARIVCDKCLPDFTKEES